MAFDSVVPPEHPLAIELRELIHDRRLLDFFERAVDGIWLWDLTEDGTSYVSPAFGRVFGYEPWEYEQGAAFWKGICHPDDWAASMAAIQAAIAADEPYDMTVRMRHKDGTWRWSRSVGLILRDETGQPQRGFGLHHDVTGLMRAQALLEREAIHDPLTELLNRRGIEQALEDILAHVQRLDCEAYALFIDLDNFKQVNDQHGHATGDQVLRATAHTIQHAVRVVDAVGRLGGDEFLLFLRAFPARPGPGHG
jgi:PAS domain S-box-containing protein